MQDGGAKQHIKLPKWRNWQTRRIQNPVPARGCGFDSLLRHFLNSPKTAPPAVDPHLDIKAMTTTKNCPENIKYPRTIWRSSKALEPVIDRLLVDLRKNIGKGLHLGAGASKLPGLINCDLYNPQADMKADATNLEMFTDNSIDLIESHHMIEHLSFADTEKALKEWQRVLRPGGLLIITFPDITRICLRWLKYIIIYPIKPRPEKLARIVQMIVGSQEHAGMFHKSAYNIILMRRLLLKYGFRVEFSYAPYPRRTTPSLLVISRKIK